MIRFLCLFLLLAGCSTTRTTQAPVSSRSYMTVIDKNSDRIRRYSGFYNTLDVEATILNKEILSNQLYYLTSLYQWDESKSQAEGEKIFKDSKTSTQFFVSFFTPERKNIDLSKKNTIWKFFLDVDGRRFEGTATRFKAPMAETEVIYPYHNRFYIPYLISFPVPTEAIENKPVELTITGAVDSGTLKFQQVK